MIPIPSQLNKCMTPSQLNKVVIKSFEFSALSEENVYNLKPGKRILQKVCLQLIVDNEGQQRIRSRSWLIFAAKAISDVFLEEEEIWFDGENLSNMVGSRSELFERIKRSTIKSISFLNDDDPDNIVLKIHSIQRRETQ